MRTENNLSADITTQQRFNWTSSYYYCIALVMDKLCIVPFDFLFIRSPPLLFVCSADSASQVFSAHNDFVPLGFIHILWRKTIPVQLPPTLHECECVNVWICANRPHVRERYIWLQTATYVNTFSLLHCKQQCWYYCYRWCATTREKRHRKYLDGKKDRQKESDTFNIDGKHVFFEHFYDFGQPSETGKMEKSSIFFIQNEIPNINIYSDTDSRCIEWINTTMPIKKKLFEILFYPSACRWKWKKCTHADWHRCIPINYAMMCANGIFSSTNWLHFWNDVNRFLTVRRPLNTYVSIVFVRAHFRHCL